MDDDAALAMAIAQSLEDTAGSPPSGLAPQEENLAMEDQENIDRAIALSLQEQHESPTEARPAENPQTVGNSTKGGYLSSFLTSLFRGSFFQDSKDTANPSSATVGPPTSSSSVRTGRNSGQQLNPFTASITRSLGSPPDSLCPTCANPVSPLFQHVKFADHLYHDGCFRCFGCHELLITASGNQTQSFSIKDGLPYHPKCAQRLFALPCSICHCALQGRFYVHPFFEDFRYCLSHEGSRPSCFACRRQEPLLASDGASPSSSAFIVLPDGRHLCGECSETVVMESAEMKILYEEVLHYFLCELNLHVPAEMFDVPILAVDLYSLNEHLLVEQREGLFETSGHNHPSPRPPGGSTTGTNNNGVEAAKGTTVGLTLSTVGTVRYFQPTAMAKQLGIHQLLAAPSRPHESMMMKDMSGFFTLTKRQATKVTGILILFGLPHDYTASVIAHEAFHAYMRLSPQFQAANAVGSGGGGGQPSAAAAATATATTSYALPSYLQSITPRREGKHYPETRCPAVVEEGLCELMAFKYLDHLSQRCTQAGIPLQTGDKDLYEEQRAERFRAYCRYRIRTNENPVYGEGFRRAHVLADTVSLPVLLEYVAENRDFPPV